MFNICGNCRSAHFFLQRLLRDDHAGEEVLGHQATDLLEWKKKKKKYNVVEKLGKARKNKSSNISSSSNTNDET